MSKRAKEVALKAYPPKRKVVSMTGAIYTVVGGDFERRIFQEGYEQAEKDIAPLIEVAKIVYEAWNGGTMDDVRRAMAELGKRIKED